MIAIKTPILVGAILIFLLGWKFRDTAMIALAFFILLGMSFFEK